MTKIKLKLNEIREEKGLGLRELSRLSGVSVGYLSELENPTGSKENPSVEIICRLAAALEVDAKDLFEC